MTLIYEILNNKLLFWSLTSCISAQFLKVIFNLFHKRELRFGVIFETGGMPSSHSALICSVAAGIGLENGFESSMFAFSVAISLIVMYDASGVRKSAGLQAIEINKISRQLDKNSQSELKEKLGHTKVEVIVGSLLGPIITLPGIIFLGSPLDLWHLIVK